MENQKANSSQSVEGQKPEQNQDAKADSKKGLIDVLEEMRILQDLLLIGYFPLGAAQQAIRSHAMLRVIIAQLQKQFPQPPAAPTQTPSQETAAQTPKK